MKSSDNPVGSVSINIFKRPHLILINLCNFSLSLSLFLYLSLSFSLKEEEKRGEK